jgi:hypothetical protein
MILAARADCGDHRDEMTRGGGLYQGIDHRFLADAKLSASTMEQHQFPDASYDSLSTLSNKEEQSNGRGGEQYGIWPV